MTCNFARLSFALLGFVLISTPAFSQAPTKAPDAKVSAPASPAADAPADASGKAPVPDVARLEQLREEVRRAYPGPNGFGDTTPEGRKRLANTLLNDSKDAEFNLSQRYAMLDTSLQLATSVWDVDLALLDVDSINQSYAGDEAARTFAAFSTLATSAAAHAPPEDCARIASKGLDLIEDDMAQGDYPGALAFLDPTRSVSDKSGDESLKSRLDPINVALSDYSHWMSALDTLKTDPTNPQANTEAGKSCLMKGDVDAALRYLSKGPDKGLGGELRDLATKDLACPQDPALQEARGDAWAAFGQKEKSRLRAPALARAIAWYELAKPKVSGFDLKRVQNKADDVERQLTEEPGEDATARAVTIQPLAGDKRVRAAIDNGLAWLCRHQDADGAWRAKTVTRHCDAGTPCSTLKKPNANYDPGLTGLSVLALLGASATPGAPFEIVGASPDDKWVSTEVLSRAISWLLLQQNEDGAVPGDMYNQCITATALCEASRVFKNTDWHEAAKHSLAFVIAGQKPNPDKPGLWGWRYAPKGDSVADSSVTGWALRAYEAAGRCGLQVPKESLAGAADFLKFQSAKSGLVGYVTPAEAGQAVTGHNDKYQYHSGTMTSLGILGRLETGLKLDPDWLAAAVNDVLLKDCPQVSDDGLSLDYYYWHHGALAWSALGAHGLKSLERAGRPWCSAAVESLLAVQSGKSDKCSSGGWLKTDHWCDAEGPACATALNVMTLEVLAGAAVLVRSAPAAPGASPVAAAAPSRPGQDWKEVRERDPDPKVITDSDLLKRLRETGLPWRVVDKSSGIEMLCVPHGKFRMGAPQEDAEAQAEERPVHDVMLTHDFYLARYETRASEWGHVVSGAALEPGLGLPMAGVSFNEIQGFLGKSDGLRLPTEAEWEYAARAGCSQPRFSDLPTAAWYAESTTEDGAQAVGGRLANGLGLHDMLGNLNEWCADWYDPTAYKAFAAGCSDPAVFFNPKNKLPGRVVRGGSFLDQARWLRFSTRMGRLPTSSTPDCGFRVAHDP